MDERQSYLAYFHLEEQPFAPTADSAYWYATRDHQECLFRLWNGIDERHGISVVLGGAGTGKTSLLRKLASGMAADPERYTTAVIGSPIPSWTSFALLESIVAQFGLCPRERSFAVCLDALNQTLVANRRRISTLIIDDAQNLNKRGQLELLRLVQNLETQQHKLLNLVLFAQREWSEVLRAAPSFEQRINVTYILQPIPYNETRDFIAFRLAQAGAREGEGLEFEESALRAIHAYAEGNPRTTVTLCRHALLEAAQLRTRRIGHDVILRTIEKTMMPDMEKRSRVAAAVLDSVGDGVTGTGARSGAGGEADRTGRERMSRDQRAAELLLKTTRLREERGPQ